MTRYMIDLLEEAGEFPKRIPVGRRAVFWSEAEVARYLEKLKDRRAGGLAATSDTGGAA
jgi:predicted DNA-binding transcriptional regulator AlpA